MWCIASQAYLNVKLNQPPCHHWSWGLSNKIFHKGARKHWLKVSFFFFFFFIAAHVKPSQPSFYVVHAPYPLSNGLNSHLKHWFQPNIYQNLHSKKVGPFWVIKCLGESAYLLELPSKLRFNPIFNLEDLFAYCGHQDNMSEDIDIQLPH